MNNKNAIFFPKMHIKEHNCNELFLSRRVELNDQVGTIRYIGSLKHKSDDDIWVGIEWDDHSRGKHDGEVEGYKYFQTVCNWEKNVEIYYHSKICGS